MTEIRIGQTTSNGWTKVAEFEVDGNPEFLAIFTGPPAERTGMPVVNVKLDGVEIFRGWTAEDYSKIARSLGELGWAATHGQKALEALLIDLVRDLRRQGRI